MIGGRVRRGPRDIRPGKLGEGAILRTWPVANDDSKAERTVEKICAPRGKYVK